MTWTDSDWAGCTLTRKSTTCYFLYNGSHLLESTAVDQQVVSVSSGEAEFYDLGALSAAALGLKELLQDLGIIVKVKVYCDIVPEEASRIVWEAGG